MSEYNKKHWQHTKEYVYELNTPTNKELQPFRMTDEVMVVGKFKGMHISKLPEYYIIWLIKNYRGLNNTSKKKLESYIK